MSADDDDSLTYDGKTGDHGYRSQHSYHAAASSSASSDHHHHHSQIQENVMYRFSQSQQLYEAMTRLGQIEVQVAERDMEILKLVGRTCELERRGSEWDHALQMSSKRKRSARDIRPPVPRQIAALEKGVSTINIQDHERHDAATQTTSGRVVAQLVSACIQVVNTTSTADAGVETLTATADTGAQTDVQRLSLGTITNVVSSGDGSTVTSVPALVAAHLKQADLCDSTTSTLHNREGGSARGTTTSPPRVLRSILKKAVSFSEEPKCAEYDNSASIKAAPATALAGSYVPQTVANAKKRESDSAGTFPASPTSSVLLVSRTAKARLEGEAVPKRRREEKAGMEEKQHHQYASTDAQWPSKDRTETRKSLANAADVNDESLPYEPQFAHPRCSGQSSNTAVHSGDGVSDMEDWIFTRFLQLLLNLQTYNGGLPVPLLLVTTEMERSLPHFVEHSECASVADFILLVQRRSDLHYTGSLATDLGSVFLSLTSSSVPQAMPRQSSSRRTAPAATSPVSALPPPLCRNFQR